MPSHSGGQLPLRIGLQDSATFDNFTAGPNRAVIHALQQDAESFVYLWGGRGSGKSHLLQALCHRATAAGGTPAYLPMVEMVSMAPGMLEGLEGLPLVCIDDIQAIAGRLEWETALFHLYNRIRESGTRLVVAADAAAPALPLVLPDLASRLVWGPVFQLQALSDEDKAAALAQRARGRGLELPAEVATYLVRRCPRDMHALFALLERLDQASLTAQRKLTVPFVRELILQSFK